MARPMVVRMVLCGAVLSSIYWVGRDRSGLPRATIGAVERAVEAERRRHGIPGLSVAIACRRGRWSGGSGMADLENDVPAGAETVYPIASISKPITAVAVMQLAERGRLDLDAPIQAYVPDFPRKPWPITPRQLLAHLGGIRNYRGDEQTSTRHYDHWRQALCRFRDDPLVHEPGTRHAYSTYGYNLLGAAVEGASGMDYADYVRVHILRPARMEHTVPDDVLAIIPHHARGYAKTRRGTLRTSDMIDTSDRLPGGGWCATADDLARFAVALQAGALIEKETLDRMWARQETRDGRLIDYGFGWSLSRHAGHDEVWHAGHQPRVSTLLYMRPEQGLAVALLTNLEGVELLDLARTLADMVAAGP
jgi:serine beta-lactamase-like protein LACTB